jgi:DNA-directed RNA polymerase subunit F
MRTQARCVDKKFYKAEFDKLVEDPEYSDYIEDLLEAAMSKKRSTEAADVDPESYEEVRSIAMEVEGSDISPED